jgi:hypothetical protein
MMPGGTPPVMPPKPMMPGGTPPKLMASITGFNLYNGPGVVEHAYFP